MARPLKSAAMSNGRRSEWTELAPRAGLRGVVEAAWIGSAGWARRLRLIPDGCADLVWDGRHLSASPARDQPAYGPLAAGACNVGLRIRCGLAGAIFGGEPSLSTWGALAPDGEERLRHARDPRRQVEILQELVEHRLADSPVDLSVLAAVDAIRAGAPLENAAQAAGLEPRELRRRFTPAVGLSPKRLQRVLRFERLRRRLGGTSDADLAAELGYADQAHMIRECRAISGSTPRQLAR